MEPPGRGRGVLKGADASKRRQVLQPIPRHDPAESLAFAKVTQRVVHFFALALFMLVMHETGAVEMEVHVVVMVVMVVMVMSVWGGTVWVFTI
jgi:hypothetical protein